MDVIYLSAPDKTIFSFSILSVGERPSDQALSSYVCAMNLLMLGGLIDIQALIVDKLF